MRVTYILAVMAVVTLHTCATASPSVDSKAAIKNGAVPGIVDSNLKEGGRMLRHVNNDYDDLDDDDLNDAFEEERGFGDVIKKLNPVTAAKKSAERAAERAAKAREALKDAADYQKMLEKAREMVNKD